MRRLILAAWLLASVQLALAAPLRVDQVAPGVYEPLGVCTQAAFTDWHARRPTAPEEKR